MKIGILGYGFVGKAHHLLLKDQHEIFINDPAFVDYSDPLPDDVEAIIACVSTPAAENGDCDMSHIYKAITDNPKVPILIKSTISLEGWREMLALFPKHQISFSPEFLRASTAVEDLRSQEILFVGGGNTKFWNKVFEKTVLINDPEVLILTKYFRNSFLASKVSFFNQIYDLCQAVNVSYDNVSGLVGMDDRIGNSHTEITAERGFGGHCFPKDTMAIINTAKKNNVNLSILTEVVAYNNQLRKQDNENTDNRK